MIPKLENYKKIIGKKEVKSIKESAENLKDRHIVNISSTSMGGGVAEILNTLVFLLNGVGIKTDWRVIIGSHSFFEITKQMHNSLQGAKMEITPNRRGIYLEYCDRNSVINHLTHHDAIVVHDPQPLGMVRNYARKTVWLWRCHIDISAPYLATLEFLLPFIRRYDGVIVSSKKFMLKNLSKPQFVIHPSIDPLSPKNVKISSQKARRLLTKRGIEMDKPIISQISRFDPWKDHLGVIKMYKKIREKEDCQLVLMGDMASDDPEGPSIYHKIKQKSELVPGITLITEKNDLLVNALQQESAFVFQNSIREGFALTVSEALWKKTPVIGTAAGGIPLQIKDGKTGFIMKNNHEGAKKGLKLLRNEKLRKRLGNAGHNHVKENFLITRHLRDYIKLLNRFF